MTNFYSELLDFLQKKDLNSLRQKLKELDSFQIAATIEDLPKPNDVFLFRLLPRELAKEIFKHLSHDKQEEIVESFAKNLGEITNLLNDLDPDDRTAFLEELPGEVTQKLLQYLSEHERSIAIKLLGYPEDSIGRLMTPEYVSVKPSFTIAKTLDHIRKFGQDSETLNNIYVVDDSQVLIDEIRIKEIILASPEKLISDLMDYRFVALRPDEDQERAIRTFSDYDRVALPVVDTNGILLGIVTIDDMMDVAEEETTEDFHKMAAVSGKAMRDKLLQVSVPNAIRLRLPWLIITLFGGMLAGGVIQIFEEALSAVIVLAMFIPVIMDMGGDIGIQTSTIVIRGLATGDINRKNAAKCMMREIRIGISMGVICGIVVGIAGQIWQGVPMLGVAVGSAMIATITVATFLGALLPVLFNRIGVDPAVVSGPLITTIKDITGLLIYFTIASLVMGI
ncbi:MAG TPA: magnesium transporter [Bacteroidales bacterium]|nr:magnesium transporter [Bacteroidales bacterium]